MHTQGDNFLRGGNAPIRLPAGALALGPLLRPAR
jgi:hypothetical protein